MKLCRFGAPGEERTGLIGGDGRLFDLSAHCPSLGGAALAPQNLAKLALLDPAALTQVDGSPRFGPPITAVSKFICIGLNYSDHAAESGLAAPDEPVVFMKATTAICGPHDDVMQPVNCTKLDWEVELGVVIGVTARDVSEVDALEHVAGYCTVNDVSERAFQMQSAQWDKGKGCDTFGPIGPWLVTRDEIPDPQALALWLDVNGRRMQSGNTKNMIFGVAEIISYLSRYMTLLPGDIIATGTPAGVGLGQKPDPVWLGPGDTVELGIEGLGHQRQTIIPYCRRSE